MQESFLFLKWNFVNFEIKEIYFVGFIKFEMSKFLLVSLIKIIIFNLFEFILERKYSVSFINYFGNFFVKFQKFIFEIWKINFGFKNVN